MWDLVTTIAAAVLAAPLLPCPKDARCRVLYDHEGTQLIEEVAGAGGRAPDEARCALDAGGRCSYWWARRRPVRRPARRLVYRGPCLDIGADDRCTQGTICCRVHGGDFVLDDLGSRFHPSTETVGLRPLAMREEHHTLEHGAGGADLPYPHFELGWDWARFAGEGAIVESGDLAKLSGCPKPGAAETPRPAVVLPALPENPRLAFDWRRDALGSCAAAFGGATGRGVALWGGPGAARAIPEVRALAAGSTLYVDVRDPKPAAPAANWLDADHVEIWIGLHQDDPYRYPGPYSLAYQWGIGLADGKVHPGYGHPAEGPLVERAEKRGPDGTQIVAFAIHLVTPLFRSESCDGKPVCTPQPEGVALSYSAGDGTRVLRLVSTDALCYGNAASLGVAFPIPADLATCAVRGGALEVERVDLAKGPADHPVVH